MPWIVEDIPKDSVKRDRKRKNQEKQSNVKKTKVDKKNSVNEHVRIHSGKQRKQDKVQKNKTQNCNETEYEDVSFENLEWNKVSLSKNGFVMNGDDEMGGLMCIEELDGVDVSVETSLGGGKMISFKKVKKINKSNSSNRNKKHKENSDTPNINSVENEGLTEELEDLFDFENFIHVDDFVEDDKMNKNHAKKTKGSTQVDELERNRSRVAAQDKDSLDPPKDDNKNDDMNVVKEMKVNSPQKKDTNENEDNEKIELSGWIHLNLDQRLLKAIKDLNFASPTEIQDKVLPVALSNKKDIIGVAETGSGKTLAFGLPILQYILTKQIENIESKTLDGAVSLILAPTRELAMQINDHLKSLSKYTPIKIASIVGGLSHEKQKRLISMKPHIVVATPGRLWELMSDDVEFKQHIQGIKYFVLDEADRMLEKGHFQEFSNIMKTLSTSLPSKNKAYQRRVFLFSATLLTDQRLKIALKKKNQTHSAQNASMDELFSKIDFLDKDPVRINVLRENNILAKTLTETKIDCLVKDKDLYLYYMLSQHPGRTLVFVNAIDGIRRLVPILNLLQVPCFGLHAEMQQRQRLKNLDRFKSKENCVMVASDVAARGLDIPNVNHVIHYQLPRSADLYVHRSGRTARARNDGISVMLCAPEEVQVYKKICYILKKDDGLPEFNLDRLIVSELKSRVQLAKEINELEHRSQKQSHEENWIKKRAEEAELDFDSDDDENDENKHVYEDKNAKKTEQTKMKLAKVKQLKLKLKEMLQVDVIAPSIRKGFLGGQIGYAEKLIDQVKNA